MEYEIICRYNYASKRILSITMVFCTYRRAQIYPPGILHSQILIQEIYKLRNLVNMYTINFRIK